MPMLLVTGDRAVCEETKELLGDGLTTVEVKQGLGRFSARHIPPKRARKMIEDGAKQALSNLKAVPPWDPGSPCEVKVEFTNSDQTEAFVHRLGVELLDGRTIVSRADNWWDAWRQMYFGG